MLTPDHMGRYMGKGHWDMWMYTWRHWVWRGMDRMRCRLWGPIWKTKREKHVKKGIGIERGPLNNGSKSHICLNATFQRLVSFSRNFFVRISVPYFWLSSFGEKRCFLQEQHKRQSFTPAKQSSSFGARYCPCHACLNWTTIELWA